MADAPRFRFWWQQLHGTSILSMPRQDWDDLVGTLGQPVEIDVRATPLSAVTQRSSVVAAVAHQFAAPTARLSIFRYDEADAPLSINQDEYDVWVDLAQHPRLPEMIVSASTSDNENFRSFCTENVFFSKRPPGPDHWLPTVPSSITVIFRRSSRRSL